MLKFFSLSSGSCGNCYYLGTEEKGILIDAGASCRKLVRMFKDHNINPDTVQAVLVTHSHLDHIKFLGSFCKKLHKPVYTTSVIDGVLACHSFTSSVIGPYRHVIPDGESVELSGISVRFFEVPHDARQTVGYAISIEGHKFVIMTDVGRITDEAVEYAGQAVRSLSMEGRLTLCNLSIEMGARGGFIAPDETTFEYLKGREYSPKGEDWDRAVEYWKTLRSGDDAVFDRELSFDASEISPMITYGTNPGMGMPIDGTIPSDTSPKALAYMGLEAGRPLLGHKVDYVFLGACTNGRIEDFRAFASLVRGRRKADGVTAWLVPGSWAVKRQIEEEGLDRVLGEAGFEVRQPGCSACLAMNDDKIPEGRYAVSTSNRNFEGRQGPGSRTLLASPLTAAAAAVTGRVTDPRELL